MTEMTVEDTVIAVPHVRYEYQMTILTALQSKPIYGGTVSGKEIARRRKANRIARSQNRLTINDRRK